MTQRASFAQQGYAGMTARIPALPTSIISRNSTFYEQVRFGRHLKKRWGGNDKFKLKNNGAARARFRFLIDKGKLRIFRGRAGYNNANYKKSRDRTMRSKNKRHLEVLTAGYKKRLKRLVPYWRKEYCQFHKGRNRQGRYYKFDNFNLSRTIAREKRKP